jgi:hypothetical protein
VTLHQKRVKQKLTRDQQVYKDELIEMVKIYIESMGKDAPIARIHDFNVESGARKVFNSMLDKYNQI